MLSVPLSLYQSQAVPWGSICPNICIYCWSPSHLQCVLWCRVAFWVLGQPIDHTQDIIRIVSIVDCLHSHQGRRSRRYTPNLGTIHWSHGLNVTWVQVLVHQRSGADCLTEFSKTESTQSRFSTLKENEVGGPDSQSSVITTKRGMRWSLSALHNNFA